MIAPLTTALKLQLLVPLLIHAVASDFLRTQPQM